MTSQSTRQSSHPAGPTTRATVTGGAVAAVFSAIAAVLAGIIGKAAGASHVKELSAGALATLAIAGVILGTVAWTWIGNRPGGHRLLTVLVPVVLVLSFIPDIALGLGGTAWSAVVTLMIAHAAVFAVTIPALIHWIPPRTTPRSAARHLRRWPSA
jgi:hypothetical protein